MSIVTVSPEFQVVIPCEIRGLRKGRDATSDTRPHQPDITRNSLP